jgi:hypothetical protein
MKKKVVIKKKIVKSQVTLQSLANQMTTQLASVTVELKKNIDTRFQETESKIEAIKHYVKEQAKEVKTHIDDEMLSIREYINNENLSLLASTQGQFSVIQMELEKMHKDLEYIKIEISVLGTKVTSLEEIVGTQNVSKFKSDLDTIQTKINQLSKLDIYIKSGYHDDEIKKIKVELSVLSTKVNRLVGA